MATTGHRAEVALVTDSTAYLPAEVVGRYGVRVVPLSVVIGGDVHDEGGRLPPDEVASALTRYVPVSTSRPAPAALAAAYAAAAADGASAVVSVHLSAGMSGTVEAAELAAREAPVPVHVVDSRSLGMGIGFAVMAAGDALADGATAEEAAAVAHKRALATSVFFCVHTLEHLRRGGRIGAAQALLGSALAVKPLLRLDDGRVVPVEKVRTLGRAVARLEELAAEAAGVGPVDIAVHHLADPARAAAVAERLRQRVPGLVELYVAEVGAVVGAHVGPGMVGVAVAPR